MELTFEKWDDGRWFVVLPEYEGMQEDLEMVDGADTFLDFLCEDDRFVTVDVSLDYMPGYAQLELVDHNSAGATYQVIGIPGFYQDVWLCNVMHYVFGEHPETIYVKVL